MVWANSAAATRAMAIWLVAVLLASALVAAVPRGAAADAFDDLTLAVGAFRAEEFDTALTLLDGAIASGELAGETLAGAHSNRGLALAALDRFEAAVGAFSAALEMQPDLAQALRSRGLTLAQLGRFAEAIPDLDKGLEARPRDPFVLNERGLAYAGLGQHARAAEDFEAALEMEPGFIDARTNLRAAVTAAGEVDRLAAIDAEELALAARAQTNDGQYLAAFQIYTRALEVDPRNPTVLFERGVVLMNLGRYADSVADYDVLLADDPDSADGYYNRAFAHAKLGQFAQAIADYSAELALRPDYMESFYLRGQAHGDLSNYEAAVADYTVVLAREVFNTRALRARGYAAFYIGRFELTEGDFELSVRDDGAADGTRICSAIWSYLGTTHLGGDGEPELAANMEEVSVDRNRFRAEPIDMFTQVWPGPVAALYLGQIGPDDLRFYGVETEDQTRDQRLAEVTFYLGQYFLAQGDVAQARALFEETIATGITSYVEYEGAAAELARLN